MRCLISSILLLAGTLLATHAQAQYPERPIRIVVPFVAGGVSDNVGRQLAQKITEQTSKILMVENRAGAGGRIGYELGAKAAPDGYTLVATDATYTMMPGIFGKLNWEHSDLIPVAMVAQMPFVITVNSSNKINTLQEFIRQAKANPRKFNYGSAGNGSVNHLVTDLFSRTTGIELTHIPFKGIGDAVVALLGNQVDLLITALPTGIVHVKNGKLTALALTSAQRSSAAPNVPTVTEAGVPFVVNNWTGLTAPKGTPKEAIDWLQKNVAQAVNTPDLKQRINGLGADVNLVYGEEFGKMITADTQRWTDVIKAAGIKAE